MNDQELSYLLAQLYKYYPVGLGNFTNYAGYLEIGKIVTHKIDDECNNPSSVSNIFVKKLQDDLPMLKIENKNFYQFPNYLTSILLPVNDEGLIRRMSRLEICVSLLCEYYTYYVVDTYSFIDLYADETMPAVDIHSFEQNEHGYEEFLPVIQENLEYFFPAKKFIAHIYLTKTQIAGITPFPETGVGVFLPEAKQSLFQLLFHPDLFHGRPQINLR